MQKFYENVLNIYFLFSDSDCTCSRFECSQRAQGIYQAIAMGKRFSS